MKIISHRGYWHNVIEKNSEIAFQRSINTGFGIETDVRDSMGSLVIAHDLPCGKEIPLINLSSVLVATELVLALNIKADGLAELVKRLMEKHNRSNWFVFDMSIPDMRNHLAAGNPVFARMSEVEQEPPWFNQVEGIWLDSFEGEWFDLDLIKRILAQGKRVCIASSELHGRNHLKIWTDLISIANEDRVILCTDYPGIAAEFFNNLTNENKSGSI